MSQCIIHLTNTKDKLVHFHDNKKAWHKVFQVLHRWNIHWVLNPKSRRTALRDLACFQCVPWIICCLSVLLRKVDQATTEYATRDSLTFPKLNEQKRNMPNILEVSNVSDQLLFILCNLEYSKNANIYPINGKFSPKDVGFEDCRIFQLDL